MSEQRDPPRWLESGFLSEEHASEFAAYGSGGAPAASKERMFAQLSTQLGEAALVKPALLGKLKLWLGSAAVLVSAVGVMLALEPTPLPARLREQEAQYQATPTRLAPLTVLPPSHQQQEAPVVRRAPQRRVETPPPAHVDVIAELAMLARARRALLNDPLLALVLSDEHARDFPRGTFEEEREVLAIESLIKLARLDDARQRARAFAVRFPRSAQHAHLAKLIAKPSE